MAKLAFQMLWSLVVCGSLWSVGEKMSSESDSKFTTAVGSENLYS